MLPPQIIFGYHGCDLAVARMVLEGGTLRPSINAYDWLGSGIYFWERSPVRALRWAEQMARLPGSLVQQPAVLGAIIDLGHCLDLADPDNAALVTLAHDDFVRLCRTTGMAPPQNRGAESKARFLDCAIMNHLHSLREDSGEPPYDTVRGFFNEGQPVYPTAGLRTLDHVQICIRNTRGITGFFRPNIG